VRNVVHSHRSNLQAHIGVQSTETYSGPQKVSFAILDLVVVVVVVVFVVLSPKITVVVIVVAVVAAVDVKSQISPGLRIAVVVCLVRIRVLGLIRQDSVVWGSILAQELACGIDNETFSFHIRLARIGGGLKLDSLVNGYPILAVEQLTNIPLGVVRVRH
jgi:hypothetical protein